MRIGAVFSQADSGTDPDAIRQWAIDAEAAGFEHLLAYDHVLGASAERLGPGPFGSFPNAPYTSEHTFHEILVLFSHLAAVTTTMQFVTSVLVLPQRQTAVVAKQIASIDLLSGGRIRLAVGVGWNAAEYEGPGRRLRRSHGAARGADRRDAHVVDPTDRRLRGPLPQAQRRRYQPAADAHHPDHDRQRGVRCRAAASGSQGRWLDAAADSRSRPADIGTAVTKLRQFCRGGGSRPGIGADPRPRLHRSWLAGSGRASAGARVQRLQHRVQPARPTGPVTCRAPRGIIAAKPEIDALVG